MNSQKQGRNELKFLLSYAEYMLISSRISSVLDYDKNSGRDGYFIRSIYLDDLKESCYNQKMDGISDRKKYRIRAYNNSPNYISLECKEKHNRWVYKTNSVIDEKICNAVINDDYSILEDCSEQVCREVYAISKERGLKTSVIVDYHREAYVYPVSNLRITFDKNLHAGGVNGFFMFNDNISDEISLPVYINNSVILEVKYDNYIPEFIRRIIPSYVGKPLSISKYCICKNILKTVRY